jgi:hypothetical protein
MGWRPAQARRRGWRGGRVRHLIGRGGGEQRETMRIRDFMLIISDLGVAPLPRVKLSGISIRKPRVKLSGISIRKPRVKLSGISVRSVRKVRRRFALAARRRWARLRLRLRGCEFSLRGRSSRWTDKIGSSADICRAEDVCSSRSAESVEEALLLSRLTTTPLGRKPSDGQRAREMRLRRGT